MNFTRWSARLPGTQRRAAARDDRSSVPAARAESARADGSPALLDDPSPASSGPASTEALPGPALDDLSAREILGRLPAPVALLHGPDHRVAYVNDAYEAAFGPRPSGVPRPRPCPS